MSDPQPILPTAASAGPGREATPAMLVLGAVISVQFGAAIAVSLLPVVGVIGSVTVRLVLAAVLLGALARPRVRGRSGGDWLTVSMFAVVLLGMNAAFYGSLARLPIGVAVTVEFLGPLVLAAVTSQRGRDLAAVAVALLGVVLICEILTVPIADLDLIGIGLAATAGACWAAYIVLSGRTGARFEGLDGIAICMAIAAVLVTPAGILGAGADLASTQVLALGLGVALLSSAIPYSLELVALRTLAAGVFGVLLSLEPAVAALAGFLVLEQRLHAVQLAGMACVILASALVLGRATAPTAPAALTAPDAQPSRQRADRRPIGSGEDGSGTISR